MSTLSTSIMKIIVEGNIGGGKSTVLRKVANVVSLPVFLEPVDTEWKEGLSYFYSNPARWGLTFNFKVLDTYHTWNQTTPNAIYERSPLSCKNVFTKLQILDKTMTEFEAKLFESMYGKLAWEPEVLIYINTSPEVCYERMSKRARECESSVPLSYLEQIKLQYEVMLQDIKNNGNIVVHEVDGNRCPDDIYEDVLRLIKTYL